MKRRGFALIYQLMISLIVFMLLGALLTLSRTQIFNAHSEIAGLRAQYAAESGLASVMAEITRNVSWRDGFARAALPGGTETYSVQFTAGTPGPDDSVNNLQQNTPADSYLGPATVPPHSAFIVVRGESAGSVRTLEAYLVGAGNPPRGTALAAVSTISLLGNGTIDAYNSMRSLGYIPVNVHSNSEAGPRAFSYKALRSGDRLEVQGRIGTVSDAPDAIHFEGPHTVGSQAPGAAYSKFPEMNVSAIVATHSVSPGTPLPNVGGVTLGAGDHYYSGDQHIAGDLKLVDGARVFVAGNLNINGSVQGSGVLLVDGNALFHGDSKVSGDKTQYVSVATSGHTVLAGFDGTSYLRDLAAAQPANSGTPRGQENGELVQDVQDNLQWMQEFLRAHPTHDSSWNDPVMDAHSAVLAQSLVGWGGCTDPNFMTNLPNQPHRNSMGLLRSRLPASGETPDFLRRKLKNVDDVFRAANVDQDGTFIGQGGWPDQLRRYLDGTWTPAGSGGLFDIVQSLSFQTLSAADQAVLDVAFPQIQQTIDQLDYNRLGAAQFTGMIFAQGGVLALNEVNVLGCVVARGTSSAAPLTQDGETIRSGEIKLASDCRVTYVQDMFENGAATLASLGVVDVASWRLR